MPIVAEGKIDFQIVGDRSGGDPRFRQGQKRKPNLPCSMPAVVPKADAVGSMQTCMNADLAPTL
jgi:hypothetical protein